MPEEQQQRPWLQLPLPIFLWASAFFLRPIVFRGGCGTHPEHCEAKALSTVDQMALGHASVSWDFASNILQNSIGVALAFACFLPWLSKRDRTSLKRSLTLLVQNLVLIAWNGALIEIVRDIVQRPRPLVFTRPMEEGLSPMQFTSFYSGHTSFVALATMILALRFAKRAYRVPAILAALLFSGLVGTARVLGGRHFPSDVLFGALAGITIACIGLASQKNASRHAHHN